MADMINELRQDLMTLIERTNGPSVSMYLPTHRAGGIEEDRIRFKNMLGDGDQRLREMGLRGPEAGELLEPAQKLLPDMHFWKYQSDGLALFASPGLFKYYQLPITFQALLVVSERFHIKPLLRLLSIHHPYYVLALSQKSVRLLHCSREDCSAITSDSIPSSLAEALKYDDPEKQLQFHTGTSDFKGKRAAIFHGHGVGKDDTKTDILRFSRHVAKGVQEVLKEEQSPLILAAVDYLQPIYRDVNMYPHILSEGVMGSPDELSEGELLQRSRPIAESHFRQEELKAIQRYEEVRHTGLASRDLKEILIASYEGRVATLLVASGTQKWGFFDYVKQEIRLLEEHLPGSRDLLDLAAALTWSNRGDVYVLEPEKMPDGAILAATLRY